MDHPECFERLKALHRDGKKITRRCWLVSSEDVSRPLQLRAERRAAALCWRCGKESPAEGKGMCEDCSAKDNAAQRTRYADAPEDKRAASVARKHGMSIEEYRKFIAGGCAICGSTERINVDHDHACEHKRDASCKKCNRAPLCPRHNTAVGVMEKDDILGTLSYLVQYDSASPLVEFLKGLMPGEC